MKKRPVCDLVMLVLVRLGVPVSLYGLGGREGGECDCMEFKNVRGSRPGQFNGLKYQRFHQVNSAWAGVQGGRG